MPNPDAANADSTIASATHTKTIIEPAMQAEEVNSNSPQAALPEVEGYRSVTPGGDREDAPSGSPNVEQLEATKNGE